MKKSLSTTRLLVWVLLLKSVLSASAQTNIVDSHLMWSQINNGEGNWQNHVFVSASTTLTRGPQDMFYIANQTNGLSFPVPGVDDRLQMSVNGGDWETLRFISSSTNTQNHITFYLQMGANSVSFRGYDDNETYPGCYACSPLFVTRVLNKPPGKTNDTAGADSKEPINVGSGNMHFEENDLQVACPALSLPFDRKYNSADQMDIGIGPGWTHTYAWSIRTAQSTLPEVTNTWRILRTGDGSEYSFLQNTNGGFESPYDRNWVLTFTNDEYQVAFPGGTSMYFGTNGTLQKIRDSWANEATCSYTNISGTNYLIRVTRDAARYLDFTWTSNRLTKVGTPVASYYASFAYNGEDELTNAVVSTSNKTYTTRYSYNSLLYQRTDPIGTVFAHTYNIAGQATGTVVETDYYRHTVEYTDSESATLTYTRGNTNLSFDYTFYPGTRQLYSIAGPQTADYVTNTAEYSSYDAYYNLARWTRYDGSQYTMVDLTWTNGHDLARWGTGLNALPTNFWVYTWNTNWSVPESLTDPEGARIAIEYTNASPVCIKVYYDASNSYDTTLGYTTNGLLSGITNANSHYVRYFCGNYGFPTSIVPEIGPWATLEWDTLGNLKKVTLPSDELNTNDPPQMVPRVFTLSADEQGWLSKITYPDSLYDTFTRNNLGDVTNFVDRAGRTTRLSYLPTGKLASVLRVLSTGNVITNRVEYDNQFNSLRIFDALDRSVESYVLDLQDRPVVVTNLEGQTMSVEYLIGNMPSKVTRFDETVVSNQFNAAGLVSQTFYPDATKSFTYLRNNLPCTASDGTCVISNTFNQANRLTQVDVTGLLPNPMTVSYAQDPVGNPTNMTSTAGVTRRTFNAAEQVATIEHTPTGGNSLSFQYTYNTNNGLISEVTVTNTGLRMECTYTVMDQISSMAWYDVSNNVVRSFIYSFNNAGMITQVSREDGSYRQFTYDSLDQLTGEKEMSSSGVTNYDQTYTFDAVGNRTAKTHNGMGLSYTYPGGSQGNRLASWSVTDTNLFALVTLYGSANETISADSRYGELWVSNRTVMVPDVEGTNFWVLDFPINLGTQQIVAAIRDEAGNTTRVTNQVYISIVTNGSYSYADAGCLTDISYHGQDYSLDVGLTWNGQYQLTAVSTNGVECERNGYDAFGRRIWTWDPSTGSGQAATNFLVYDGVHVVADLNATGGVLRSYVWGPGIDNLLALVDHTTGTPQTYFAIKDHLGSVHALVDENGAIVEQYRFDAWGRTTVFDGTGAPLTESAVGNRYVWQGREISWKTGFYYFRARWYDPIAGRWLSNDPIGITGGLNQHVFCGNCPTIFRDPFGLCTKSGFWRYSGNALNNTVDAIGMQFGAVLYDFTTVRYSPSSGWTMNLSQGIYSSASTLWYSTTTPAAPNATPYVATSLGASTIAATTAGLLIGFEAMGITDIGSRSIGSGPPPDYRHDIPPSEPHHDKNTGRDEPDHWHKRDYNWSPDKKRWFPGKWRYLGPDAP